MNNQKNVIEISEIFTSIQGEGRYAGWPCHFIRFARCDLRCRYCDTTYSYEKGSSYTTKEILSSIPDHINLVEITGGEPLLQNEHAILLMHELHEMNKSVMIETGGHISIQDIPDFVHIIMDVKMPSSGESSHDFAANISWIKKTDEVKFVIAEMEDLPYAANFIRKHNLQERCIPVFSAAREQIALKKVADFILNEKLSVRLQIQLHKIIWGDVRGV